MIRVICLVVSLCEDYIDFCVKTMYYCAKTGFLLIYVLSEYYVYCCIIFCCIPCFGGSPSGETVKIGVI
jgi:hypothetical protein